MSQIKLPLTGKALRFAPSTSDRQAAQAWKIWTEGADVYALCRDANNGQTKLSVHASGQIHYRPGIKQLQLLAPLLSISPDWTHAIEFRFLLPHGHLRPEPVRTSKRDKGVVLIRVPSNLVLYANLVIGSPAVSPNDVPPQFMGATQLWRCRLTDGRLAVVVLRLLPLDDQTATERDLLLETLKITVTFDQPALRKYGELHHHHWSPHGGNVVFVMPMSEAMFRTAIDPPPPDWNGPATRQLAFASAKTSTAILAPNGAQVATLTFSASTRELHLIAFKQEDFELATATLELTHGALIPGSKFTLTPFRLDCVPTLGAATPTNWAYLISGAFDGNTLSIQIHSLSTSLARLGEPGPVLEDFVPNEELVITIPPATLVLAASLEAPVTDRPLIGRFHLRNRLPTGQQA